MKLEWPRSEWKLPPHARRKHPDQSSKPQSIRTCRHNNGISVASPWDVLFRFVPRSWASKSHHSGTITTFNPISMEHTALLVEVVVLQHP